MRYRRIFNLGFILFCGLGLAALPGPVNADWTAEWLFGGAWNAGTTLEIQQAGEPDLAFDAEFSSKPFEQPLFWALRVGWEGERHGWALDLNHHKLILENPPPEVETFSITHGYNLVTVQHAWLRPGWRFFALAGAVVAHPESTIRGLRKDEKTGWFDSGYEVAGPVIGGGAATAWSLGSVFEIAFEGRVTWSTVNVDVATGQASLDNLAFHLLLGPRIRLR